MTATLTKARACPYPGTGQYDYIEIEGRSDGWGKDGPITCVLISFVDHEHEGRESVGHMRDMSGNVVTLTSAFDHAEGIARTMHYRPAGAWFGMGGTVYRLPVKPDFL